MLFKVLGDPEDMVWHYTGEVLRRIGKFGDGEKIANVLLKVFNDLVEYV